MTTMESLCRLCGSEDGIKVDIFEPGTERVKKIHKILPITVNEHDPFPKQICHHCSYKVDQFFEFRTTSIKTQEILKRKVPWLRGKQPPRRNEGERPMVEVALNSVNAVSPNEKQISPSNGSMFDLSEDAAILIEDSPPYVEQSNGTNALVSECEADEQQNPTETRKPKRSKSRSMWDTKKRKKKSKSCRIAEVFTTSEQEYQNLNDIENDPLRLSPVNVENNSFDNIVENNTRVVNSPKSDLSVVEKGILTDDRGGANIALPKYILITKIPRVGNVYTCERCGRTFLNPQPASQHSCPGNQAVPVEENRPKEDPQRHDEDIESDKTKDFYQCSECGHVFTRHSQLVSHRKKHNNQAEYSSDDSFKPFNKRRKHHSKRKHKRTLLNTNSTTTKNYNSDTTITNLNSTTTNNYNLDSIANLNSTTTNNYNSDSIANLNSTTTNNYNSDNIANLNSTTTNNYNSDSTFANLNSTTTNNHNSNSTFETTGPNFLFNFDAVETNITRHSLLSSDSE